MHVTILLCMLHSYSVQTQEQAQKIARVPVSILFNTAEI